MSRIQNYSPVDDDNTIYLPRSATLGDIIDTVKAKWGERVDFDSLEIAAEHVHTNCLTHDVYDPSDYTDYLVITR